MSFADVGRGLRRCVLSAVLCLTAGNVYAGVILQVAAIDSPQGSSVGLPLSNAIDQSGLSGSYASGVDDFAAVTSSFTHDVGGVNSGFTNTESISDPQQFSLDLGGVFTLDAIAIWNAATAGSIIDFELYIDSDFDYLNGTGAQVGGTFTASQGAAAQVFTFAAVTTRFVHINALSCVACGFYALSEVAFNQASVSEPATTALLALGLLGAGFARKRRAH